MADVLTRDLFRSGTSPGPDSTELRV